MLHNLFCEKCGAERVRDSATAKEAEKRGSTSRDIATILMIVPLASVFGISPQLCVSAFAFGDGFSNVLYPTNPVLLISLGLADVGYGKWFRFSRKFQALNLLLTSGLLLFGLGIGY